MSEPAVAAVSERAGQSRAASGPARRWWILGVVGLAQLMVVLDATIVNIALPSAQHDLGFSNADRQWVVTAYALAFGGLLLLGGRLSDLFGRRRMLIIGLVGFAAASALGGRQRDVHDRGVQHHHQLRQPDHAENPPAPGLRGGHPGRPSQLRFSRPAAATRNGRPLARVACRSLTGPGRCTRRG